MKSKIAILFLFLTACATESTTTIRPPIAQKDIASLVGDYKVNRYTLSNGLRLLVVEDHSSPTFAYQTWFRVGSRDEVPGRTGLAHLFEHMMFKGTKNLKEGEFDKILESNGAEGENAFTSRDYTAYVQEVPKDKLDLIMKVESDRMVNLIVNEQSFKTELEVVQNERRFRNENSPDGTMWQELFGSAFTKHSYHWPVIGYQEDLDRMTAKDARDFYQSYYSPNHATVIVVGDVDPSRVLELANQHYGELKRQESPPHTIPMEPPQIQPRRKLLKLNIEVEKLMMGYHVPGIADADIPTLILLQTILTGGKSARMNRALVETGISSTVDSSDLEDKDPSLLIFASNLQKGRRAAEAESVILKEIDRVINTPIPADEIERAKNRTSFGFYESLSSNSEKANFLGHWEATSNNFELGIEQYKKILTVTAVDLKAVAKKYFDRSNRTVITGVRK